jgi:MFS family permease
MSNSLTSSVVEVVPSPQMARKVKLMSMDERGISSRPGWSRRLMGRFALLSVGVWLYAADTLVTATTSPGMVLEIGGVEYLNWGLSLYEVGAIIAGAVAGMLCSRFGVKRVLCIAALVYAAGCAVAAMASYMPAVVVGRMVQGLGGGMLMSLCYFAMHEWLPEKLWNRLFAIEAIIWAAGSLLGPLIGGFFVNYYSWRGAFWFFGLQAVVLLIVSISLPSDAPQEGVQAQWPFVSLVFLSAATLMIAHAGIAAGPATATIECVIGVVLLYVAARFDKRSAIRLLPVELLNYRHPIGAGLLMVFLLSMSTTGFWLYGPLILKILFDTNPVIAGYILAGEGLAWSLATLVVSRSGRLSERRLIRIGAAVICIGAAGFAIAVPSGAISGIVACALLQGLGFGLCWPAIVHRLVRFSTASERSLASASQTTIQRIGYAVGTAAAGIAANLAGLSEGISIAAAKAAALWVFAGFIPILGLAVLSAWQFTTAQPTNVSEEANDILI